MVTSADFSEDRKYRYILTRIWDESKPIAMCIGLNPSTANGEKNDATINILIDILGHLGFGGLKMVNLYALISSEPSALHDCPDPLKGNDNWILSTAYSVQEIIFCWGNFKNIEVRARKMSSLFPDAKCFGKNKNGSPWHPRALTYQRGTNQSKAKLQKF